MRARGHRPIPGDRDHRGGAEHPDEGQRRRAQQDRREERHQDEVDHVDVDRLPVDPGQHGDEAEQPPHERPSSKLGLAAPDELQQAQAEHHTGAVGGNHTLEGIALEALRQQEERRRGERCSEDGQDQCAREGGARGRGGRA